MARNRGRPRKNNVAEPNPPTARASSSSSQSSNGNPRASLAISKSNSSSSGSFATLVAAGAPQAAPTPTVYAGLNRMSPTMVAGSTPTLPASMNRGTTTTPVLAYPSAGLAGNLAASSGFDVLEIKCCRSYRNCGRGSK
ncbi:unnamed protein product [Amaranthus hypochondriacus]